MATNTPHSTLEAKRILVVEDSLFVADEVEAWLQSQNCVVVGPVPSVGAALAKIRDHPLDAAILDVNLDGEFVFDAAAELNRRSIPFVFTTGYNDTQLPDEFSRFPCLSKPVDFDRLARELCRQLRPNGSG